MRNLFFVLALLFCVNVFAQDTIPSSVPDSASVQQEMRQRQQTLDSLAARESFRQNADRSMQNFISLQKENNEKKKKQAYLYLGFGVAMLVVLIIGLRRRVKK